MFLTILGVSENCGSTIIDPLLLTEVGETPQPRRDLVQDNRTPS